jgi:hypothetical protein
MPSSRESEGNSDWRFRGYSSLLLLLGPLPSQAEPRLSNGVTDPTDGTAITGSTTDWYTASAGESAPQIEFGYIDSNRPSVSSWQVSPDKDWGCGYSVKWDVGVKTLDHHGLTKNEA